MSITERLLCPARHVSAVPSPTANGLCGSRDIPMTDPKQRGQDGAWPGWRGDRIAGGDRLARRPPGRAVRPAPAPAPGKPGAVAVRGGRAGTWPAATADYRGADRGQHQG